jgi:hypothetical protein
VNSHEFAPSASSGCFVDAGSKLHLFLKVPKSSYDKVGNPHELLGLMFVRELTVSVLQQPFRSS